MVGGDLIRALIGEFVAPLTQAHERDYEPNTTLCFDALLTEAQCEALLQHLEQELGLSITPVPELGLMTPEELTDHVLLCQAEQNP